MLPAYADVDSVLRAQWIDAQAIHQMDLQESLGRVTPLNKQ